MIFSEDSPASIRKLKQGFSLHRKGRLKRGKGNGGRPERIDARRSFMLKHIVLMKFKEGASEEDIRDMEKGLASLPPVIPEIRQYEFGRDKRKERAYDFALISAFQNGEALKRYQAHPDHVVVLNQVKALCEKIVAADFDL